MTGTIDRVAVIIPARDEESLLPACLDALAAAVQRSEVPVRTVVVLDSCGDNTADVCRSYGVDTLVVDVRNVGRARAAGCMEAIADGGRPDRLWLAHTDADTRVGPRWLQTQLDLADEGADVVLGVVDLDGDGSSRLERIHQAGYSRRIRKDGTHAHVHGASMGVRADAYQRSGGFPALTDHEDHHLALRLRALKDVVVVGSDQVRVTTSARTTSRCEHGFGSWLAELQRSDALPA